MQRDNVTGFLQNMKKFHIRTCDDDVIYTAMLEHYEIDSALEQNE